MDTSPRENTIAALALSMKQAATDPLLRQALLDASALPEDRTRSAPARTSITTLLIPRDANPEKTRAIVDYLIEDHFIRILFMGTSPEYLEDRIRMQQSVIERILHQRFPEATLDDTLIIALALRYPHAASK